MGERGTEPGIQGSGRERTRDRGEWEREGETLRESGMGWEEWESDTGKEGERAK